MTDKKNTPMSIQDLHALDQKALVSHITELKTELVQLHRALAANELPSNSVIGKTRKQIAQALTVQRQRAQQAQEEEK